MSIDIRDIVRGRPTGQRAQQIVAGTVSRQQPAPSGLTAPLFVVLPPGVTVRFDYWPQQHGGTLPAAGAAVRVGYDDQGVPFVLAWEGQFTPYSPILDPEPS